VLNQDIRQLFHRNIGSHDTQKDISAAPLKHVANYINDKCKRNVYRSGKYQN